MSTMKYPISFNFTLFAILLLAIAQVVGTHPRGSPEIARWLAGAAIVLVAMASILH